MACCTLLDTRSVSLNVIFGNFAIFLRVSDFSKFSRLFSICFRISIWNLIYTFRSGHTDQVRVSLQSGHLTYFTAKNSSKSFFYILGLKNFTEPPDSVHTLIKWVSGSLVIFVMVGHFWPSDELKRGSLTGLPISEKLSEFLYMFWDINLKLVIYFN